MKFIYSFNFSYKTVRRTYIKVFILGNFIKVDKLLENNIYVY